MLRLLNKRSGDRKEFRRQRCVLDATGLWCHIAWRFWQMAPSHRGYKPLTKVMKIDSIEQVPLAPAARATADIFEELARHGYSDRELFDLVVPKRTLARRRSENELLTVEETDKALRLRRIAMLAEQVFGNPAKAQRWMRKPKRQLAGETPLAYLASEHGARLVEEMLRRIEHGIFA
jgi:putative toxin-antitoxin system antitoxin component (TIGR02293 family)